jgi:hypothetical protein
VRKQQREYECWAVIEIDGGGVWGVSETLGDVDKSEAIDTALCYLGEEYPPDGDIIDYKDYINGCRARKLPDLVVLPASYELYEEVLDRGGDNIRYHIDNGGVRMPKYKLINCCVCGNEQLARKAFWREGEPFCFCCYEANYG